MKKDLEDAIDHAGDGFKLGDFTEYDLGEIDMDDISYFDDLSSWVEFEPGQLKDADEDTLLEEYTSYRDRSFALRALKWIGTKKFPPVVVIGYTDECDFTTAIGDGRGRINVAVSMGLENLPAVYLEQKGSERKSKR